MNKSSSEPEDSLGPVGQKVEQIVQEAARGDARLDFIELDDDNIEDDWTLEEQAYDADILKIENESIDLTQDDDDEEDISRPFVGGQPDPNLRCQHYIKGTRNPCLCGHHEQVSEYHVGDTEVSKDNAHGLNMEIRVGRFIVDFIVIKEIWVHRTTSAVVVRGLAYTRTRNLDGRLKAYKNEVCRLVEIDTNDDRPEEEQSLIEVTLEDLHPKKRVLHITNKSFPECRFDPDVYITNEDRENLAPLTARWTHIMQYPDKRYRRAQRPIDGETLSHLMEGDVLKARHRDNDSERLHRWRGETIKGGSYVSQNVEDQVPVVDGKTLRFPRHKYNAADMFSGAGGYTAGAKRAGIKVVYALDHWARCNATYEANHPEVELQQQNIMTYCNDLTLADVRFDLVHLSPPCQTWSPAHTCAGKNDSANIAALYACTDIIFRFRPRIFTFEQTFGIIQERHLPWFNALVQSLTKHGYSLRWKVIRLVEYGLPQTRKRLIMIGAAPGEKLPPFPSPTHAAEPDHHDGRNRQKRFVSAIKACWGLVPGMNLHEPSGVKQMQRKPWDGNQPMNRTITTSGGQAYHWDGERDLTLAEFARLQGFPDNYVFKAPCIKKQIGNAFPPTVVHAIMKQIVQSLEQVDDINSSPREEDVVQIDDDDEDYNNKVPYHSGGDNGVPSFLHKREPEPDYHDYPGYFEDINQGLSEEEALLAAKEESRQAAASRGQGTIDAAGHVVHPNYSAFTNNMVVGGQSLTASERAAWASWRMAQGASTPRGSSRNSRRRSSGGSSVVCTGQRQLPTIIEDDECRAGDGREESRGASSSKTYSGDENGVPGGVHAACSSPLDEKEQSRRELEDYEREDDLPGLVPVAPPSSPTPGGSHDPVFFNNNNGSVPTPGGLHHPVFFHSNGNNNNNDDDGFFPSLSHWSYMSSQILASAAVQAASSSSNASRTPLFDASPWQHDISEAEALAHAIGMSIRKAIYRHEEEDELTGGTGVGLGICGIGGSSSGFGFGSSSTLAPPAPDQAYEDSEKETYDGKGKGKGKAIFKRSLGGADDYDADDSSPPKKGRIEK